MPQAPPSEAASPTETGAPSAAARKRWATPAVRKMPPCANIRSSADAFVGEHLHAEAQRAEHAVQLGAHEVREREAAVGRAHEQRPALGETGDRLAREVVVGEQPAGIRLALERLGEERLEDGVGVDDGARGGREPAEQARPGGELARAVVAVHHRDRVAGRRRDEVDLVVQRCCSGRSSTTIAKMLVPALTLPVRGVTEQVATMPVPASPSGGHSTAPGLQRAGRIEQARALGGQLARRARPATSTSGSSAARSSPGAGRRRARRSGAASSCVVVLRRGVDREHARRVAHAEHLAAGEPPVHVAGERRDEPHLGDVRLVVEHGLVQVGDRPAQRDVDAERLGELGRGAARSSCCARCGTARAARRRRRTRGSRASSPRRRSRRTSRGRTS